MKTKILFFLAMLSLVACRKDIEQEPDKLPDATMVGANTAGCYINGELLLPKNGNQSIGSSPIYGLVKSQGNNFILIKMITGNWKLPIKKILIHQELFYGLKTCKVAMEIIL